MATVIFDLNILRGAYRDTIITLLDISLYRKTVDKGVAAEPYYLCIESWEIEQDAVNLQYEYLHWTHEAYLAKTTFEIRGCPVCHKSILALDNESVLECIATGGDLSKVTNLLQHGI